MSDNDYDKAYDAGRTGGSYTGGNSIDYAGYASGVEQRRRSEAQTSGGGGGGGGAINFKGKVMTFAIGFGLLGMFWGFVSETTWIGGIVGFVLAGLVGAAFRLLVQAFVLSVRFLAPLVWTGAGFMIGAVYGAGPSRRSIMAYGIAGAVIFFGLWFLKRLFKTR